MDRKHAIRVRKLAKRDAVPQLVPGINKSHGIYAGDLMWIGH